MGWVPAVRVEVVKVAAPLGLRATGVVFRAVVPSKKLMVPVGVEINVPVVATAAVKVTVWPTMEGLALELSSVTVPSGEDGTERPTG
jgi:hypothetical protein